MFKTPVLYIFTTAIIEVYLQYFSGPISQIDIDKSTLRAKRTILSTTP